MKCASPGRHRQIKPRFRLARTGARARGITVLAAKQSSALNMPAEINVIGRTVDEATSEVENS